MNVYSRFITEIRSYSHILNQSAFALLMREEPLTRVLDVKEDRFKIEVIMTDEMKTTNKDYFGYAFLVSSNFLMAMNIAALGHFTWLSGNQMFWHCEHIGPSGKMEQILIKSKEMPFPTDKTVLTEGEVRNALIILGSLLREVDQNFRREYLKGIVHLDTGYGDLVFYREAFANFYRSFEYFMTTRVLKKKKLGNEVKELQEGMRSLGMPDKFCEEFENLYRLRSKQVMHAQREPKQIDADDVIKIKVFTDYALHKHYRLRADQWLSEQRKDGSIK